MIKTGAVLSSQAIDLTCGSHTPDHFLKLNTTARVDLKVWASSWSNTMVALLSLMVSSFHQILCNFIQMQLDIMGLLASFRIVGLGVLSQLLYILYKCFGIIPYYFARIYVWVSLEK